MARKSPSEHVFVLTLPLQCEAWQRDRLDTIFQVGNNIKVQKNDALPGTDGKTPVGSGEGRYFQNTDVAVFNQHFQFISPPTEVREFLDMRRSPSITHANVTFAGMGQLDWLWTPDFEARCP